LSRLRNFPSKYFRDKERALNGFSERTEALSSITADHAKPLRGADDITAHPAFVPLLILLALGLGLILTFGGVTAVWTTGVFRDPDDAMRLVQVRALLAGQSWYDMTVYRLDPPGGSFMHWSRIVDIPLALLIKLFSLFTPVEMAERLMRIIFPLMLQAALYAATARIAKSLMGRAAIMPTVFLVLLSGIAFGQFQPGRIDHHAPQIVLLAFMLGSLVDAVKSQRLFHAAIAGALAAISLAISLENLPFILTLWGLVGGFWIWHGRAQNGWLKGFALGLLCALPLCFVATVGPARWFLSVPDAFSFGQLIAGMSGALVCFGLAYVPECLNTRFIRLALALAGAACVFCLVALTGGEAMRSPFADIDPLVRDIWLSNVHEAWSFARLLQKEPDSAIIFMAPLVLAVVASIVASFRETGRNRLQWIMVAAVSVMGLAMGLLLIRVFTSVSALAPLGGVWAIMQLKHWLERSGRAGAMVWCFVLLLPFGSIPWALAIGNDETKLKNPAEDCHASAAFTPFTALPPGLILAPIDAGSHLLAFTSHSVLAAPYHRNNHGNKVALDAFLASPDDARSIVIDSGAKYLAICPGLGETSVLGERNPQSLAATLVDGNSPKWLTPVSAANTPYKIFTVDP
jgi:hypothetical protein